MEREEIERRHAALIERDRWVGLEAEAESARAHAARLEARLAVVQGRLERKNVRIKALADRVRELEARDRSTSGSRLGRLRRAVRR